PIEQVMMVAAHKNDLKAAHSFGMRTAYVSRPFEHGPNTEVDNSPETYIDIVATNFIDLSEKLSDIRNGLSAKN
ncbi:MAG: haloacid dehalogenase type II, partial [Chloroflexota bacterium]|nr:haloacid dehalogenase type II [Chloroflexota bacterium]